MKYSLYIPGTPSPGDDIEFCHTALQLILQNPDLQARDSLLLSSCNNLLCLRLEGKKQNLEN